MLLHLVKQLFKSRRHLAVNLRAELLINTDGPPRGAEEIGGVKELRGEENKDVITSRTFLHKPAIASIATTLHCSDARYSPSLITAAVTPHKCHRFNLPGHDTS